MSWFIDFTESLGDSVVPKRFRPVISEYLRKAGMALNPYLAFGLVVYASVVFALLTNGLLLTTYLFSNLDFVLKYTVFLFMFPLFTSVYISLLVLLFKVVVDIKIYHKTRRMEEYFPEFLSELSLNLKAGLTLERALEDSVELEFGELKEEILNICTKVKLGMGMEAAIAEFNDSFESDMMAESFDLILDSWKKGTKTPVMIDRIVQNIKGVKFLRQKVIASVESYRIFLTTVTIFITPAMFALSYHLIDIVRAIINKVATTATGAAISFTLSPVTVNDTHFKLFSIIAVSLVAGSCSVIISIVKSGDIKESYKEIFLFVVGSIISYEVFMILFRLFFSWFRI